MVILKTKEEIKQIKEACWVVVDVLEELKAVIEQGFTTNYLNDLAEEITHKHRAKAAFLGYKGYPHTICASVNDEVVHGFPNNTPLKEGDIVTIDYGAFYNGWFGDAAFTAMVGKVSLETASLVQITERCMNKAIEKAVPGNRLGDISHTIQTHAERAGYSPIRAYVGHGIGRELHEAPKIPNYGNAKEGLILKEGMVLAIEPIVAAGSYEIIYDNNKWTTRTKDGSLVAQFEHTVAITKDGPVILTEK